MFIAALLVLILNDHWWKYEYSSWLTGKLSDFSGLFVVPIFIYAVFRPHLNSTRSIVLLQCIIAALFVIWKIAPLEICLAWISSSFETPVPSRIKDISDLIALSSLPLSYFFIIHEYNHAPTTSFVNVIRSKVMHSFVLVLCSWAMLATPRPVYYYKVPWQEPISIPFDKANVEKLAINVLRENGFYTSGGYKTTNRLIVSFSGYYGWKSVDTNSWKQDRYRYSMAENGICGEVTFRVDQSSGNVFFSTTVESFNPKLDKAQMKDEIRNRIHIPLWAALRANRLERLGGQ